MKYIECDNERNASRGNGRLRTRCRECWNKYSRIAQKKHKDYFAAYLKKYIPEWRKENKGYLEINNRSNKKAIAELKESYLKNRVMDGKSWNEELREFIEIKKTIIKIHRYGKHRVQH